MTPDLKNKVEQAIHSYIVGDVIFNTEELEELYSAAEELIPSVFKYGFFLNGSSKTINTIFVALVNACKDWGSSEDSFYDFLDKKFKGTYVSRNLVVGIIDSFIKSKSVYTISVGKRYYSTMLSHSLSPISSTESFFEMCWEIYCKDLGQQYGKGDPVCKLIVESLTNKFRGRNLNDDVSIGSKVYSFRAGLTGLLFSSPETMIELIDNTMLCIDMLFNNEPISLDKYSHILLKNWWNKKSLLFGAYRKRRYRGYRESIAIDYSQIKPRFILDEGVAKLLIPAIRLAGNFDYNPYISIDINGNNIISERLDTRGSGILMSTTQKTYDLSKFISDEGINIHVEISHCDKTIYDSKTSLFREFVVFRDGKEVTASECLPGYYFLYTPNLRKLLRSPADIHKTVLNTYSFEAVQGDVIQSENRTIFFLDEQTNRDLYFFVKEKNELIYRLNGEEYRVIDGELYVDIKPDTDVNNIGVRYEGAPFKLSEFSYQVTFDKHRYEISSLLNVGEAQRISLFRYSDNSILATINIIKFNNIQVKFDKELYYGKNEVGVFVFETEKYHEETAFNLDDDEISVPIENGEIIAKAPILRWKIDDGEWSSKPLDKGFWYKEMTNSSILYIDIPREVNCSIALTNNRGVEQQGNRQEYKLGQTIYSYAASSISTFNYVSVLIKTDKGEFYLVGDIYYKEHFVDSPLFISPLEKKIIWNPSSFIGDNDATFKFVICSGSNIVGTFDLILEPRILNCSGLEDDNYSSEVRLIGKGFLAKEETLYNEEFFLGDKKNFKFKNKTICLKTIVAFSEVRIRKEIRPIYIDTINYLGTIDNFDYYSGSLFVIDKNGRKTYLNSMYDEKNRCWKKINPVRIEIKSERSCYLGYGLDLDDENFEYDDEFALDYKGRTTIGILTEGKKNLPIDYFVFEVKNNV